jgi:hypothetical protein
MVKEGQRQTMGCWRDTYELPLFILSPEAGFYLFTSPHLTCGFVVFNYCGHQSPENTCQERISVPVVSYRTLVAFGVQLVEISPSSKTSYKFMGIGGILYAFCGSPAIRAAVNCHKIQ